MSTILLIINVLLLALAGYFKGKLDAIVDEGVKELEWDKKYNLTKSGDTKHWWYFGLYTPKFPEKFPFSSTSLVFLTDKWHFNQFMMLKCFYGAMTIFISGNLFTWFILTFVIVPIIVGIPFEIVYDWYREKLKKQSVIESPIVELTTGDEPNEEEQITSIPEKQITDELH